MQRKALLTALVDQILSLPGGQPLRVGIDGPDAAGKTTLAGELSALLIAAGRPVVAASIDRFHNPRELRYRLGADSPTGYYLDSFNLSELRRLLLDPLGPGGSRIIQTALFDFRSDSAVTGPEAEPFEAAPDSVLIFDGVFLRRPELTSAWDWNIFVQVNFDTVLARAEQRDAALIGSAQAVRARYLTRYLPAQQLYLSRYRPDLAANVVVINDHPENPAFRLKGV